MVVARSFGSIDLNDRVMTFFDHVMPPFAVRANYAITPGSGGIAYRLLYDHNLMTITANGKWRDSTDGTDNKRYADFLYDLQTAAGSALDLANGWAYSAADVIDVQSARIGIEKVASSGTEYVEWWGWSIKFQAYNF